MGIRETAEKNIFYISAHRPITQHNYEQFTVNLLTT